MTSTLTLRRPDDWHLHLRDGDALRAVVAASARQFARAIVMPNLKPPVTTPAAARAYHGRILQALAQALSLIHTSRSRPSEQFTLPTTRYL